MGHSFTINEVIVLFIYFSFLIDNHSMPFVIFVISMIVKRLDVITSPPLMNQVIFYPYLPLPLLSDPVLQARHTPPQRPLVTTFLPNKWSACPFYFSFIIDNYLSCHVIFTINMISDWMSSHLSPLMNWVIFYSYPPPPPSTDPILKTRHTPPQGPQVTASQILPPEGQQVRGRGWTHRGKSA